MLYIYALCVYLLENGLVYGIIQVKLKGAGKLAQRVKELSAKPDDLSPILGTHSGRREPAPQSRPLTSACAQIIGGGDGDSLPL